MRYVLFTLMVPLQCKQTHCHVKRHLRRLRPRTKEVCFSAGLIVLLALIRCDTEENASVRTTYEAVLRAEMFGSDQSSQSPLHSKESAPSSPVSTPKRSNILQFRSDPRYIDVALISICDLLTKIPRFRSSPGPQLSSPYSLSPLGEKAKALLVSPQKTPRKISKAPYKVLEVCRSLSPFFC